MRNFKIEYAICGSLSSSPGESGIIASSKGIVEQVDLFDRVIDCDRFLSAAQNSYAQNYITTEKFSQYYFLNDKKRTERIGKLFLRGRIRFTKFTDANRVYNRREIYFIPDSNPQLLSAVFKKLPPIVDYEQTQHGILEPQVIAIENSSQPHDLKIIYCILESFHLKEAFKLYSEIPDDDIIYSKIFSALDNLPEVYKKHIQFGFNLIASDTIAKKQLHVFSCIDAGKQLHDISRTEFSDPVLDHIVKTFFLGASLNIDESILGKEIDYANQDNLYSVFSFHYLLSMSDLIIRNEMPTSFDSRKYVPDLKRFIINNFKIVNQCQHIVLAYKALRKLRAVDDNLFNTFWNFIFSSETNNSYLNDYDLKEDIENFAKDKVENMTSFTAILNELNNLFSGINSDKVKSIKTEIFNSSLINKNTLPFEEIQIILSYYLKNAHSIGRYLTVRDLLKKFRIESNALSLTEEDVKLLFSDLVFRELSSEALTALLKRIGYSNILNFVSNQTLKKSSSTQLIEAISSSLEQELLSNKTSLEKNIELSLKIFDSEKNKLLGNRVFNHAKNLIHSYSSENEVMSLIDIISKYRNDFFKNLPFQELLQDLFSEKIDNSSSRFLIEDLIRIAKKMKSKFDIEGVRYNDISTAKFVSSLFESNMEVFNKNQIKQFYENILYSNNYQNGIDLLKDYFYICNSYNKLFQNEPEIIFDLIISDLNNNLVKTSYSKMADILKVIFGQYKSSESFWNKFFNSNLHSTVFDKFHSEKFSPLLFEDIDELRNLAEIKGFAGNKELILFLNELDKSLYNKFILNKGLIPFKIMNTLKLVNKRVLVVAGILTVMAVFSIVFSVYVFNKSSKFGSYFSKQQDTIKLLIAEIQQLKDAARRTPSVSDPSASNAIRPPWYVWSSPKEDLTVVVQPLKPSPTDELNINGVNILSRKEILNKNLSDVVDTIFLHNPKDVSNHYAGQEEAYGEELVKRNPNCFNSQKICICKKIEHIPIYKVHQ